MPSPASPPQRQPEQHQQQSQEQQPLRFASLRQLLLTTSSVAVVLFSIVAYFYLQPQPATTTTTPIPTNPSSTPASVSSAPSSVLSSSPFSANTTATPPEMSRRAATGAIVALSHGGGPLPLLDDVPSANMINSMRNRVPKILNLNSPDPALRPRAIILVTAHWQAPSLQSFPSITSGAKPDLIFDYYGFPPEAYEFKYPAPGAPELAQRLAEVAAEHDLSPSLQPSRGWDHGVFVPLLLVNPAADVPVLQVSVLQSEDTRAHFRLGRALADLQRREAEAGRGPVAIVGSGFASFHNLRSMMSGRGSGSMGPNFEARHAEWNAAVTDAATTVDPKAREDKFAGWRMWPDSYVSHPPNGADHFMPLAVCAGAAGEEEAKFYVDEYYTLRIHSYYWD